MPLVGKTGAPLVGLFLVVMHAREMSMKGVNIKGIQIFEFEMMIHVIHTRTKIDLSNMHTHMNSRTSMLLNM